MTYPFQSLPENLAAFCAMLRRDYRFRIGPRELQDAARALEIAELGDERAVRNVLRPVLAGKLEDARAFDQAFDRFFAVVEAPPLDEIAGLPEALPRDSPSEGGDGADTDWSAQSAAEEIEPAAADARGPVRDVADAEGAAGLLRASYSPFEAEGTAPLIEPADRAWRDAAAMLVSRVRAGRSRRWRPARRGQRFDLRRTLRTSLHTGGDVVMPRWRARPRRRPRFVLLIDGSRSMEPYARPALQTAVALGSVTLNVEVFTFSTSLSRVTRDVRRAAAGEPQSLTLHDAWGGGTTIGACLRQFLHLHGERLLGRDTVVIIASDGLDVGDPRLIRDAMARLSRLSTAVVWLNPLLETPGYEPTALGMTAARPYVTTFMSVKDPADLARLARVMRIK
ncbi:MAG TPA: VWA domain-containing protein [Vicinamibacterales bacterium]|nr:VWA domain-containing protein [Vicinamibacterales bacterium]